MSPTESTINLAQRLRSLRERHWPGVKITQAQLAEALGVSSPLISSWERPVDPVVPGEDRIRAYALFFCTHRSIKSGRYRTIDRHALTE